MFDLLKASAELHDKNQPKMSVIELPKFMFIKSKLKKEATKKRIAYVAEMNSALKIKKDALEAKLSALILKREEKLAEAMLPENKEVWEILVEEAHSSTDEICEIEHELQQFLK